MTIWSPTLDRDSGGNSAPLYRRIADQLERDVDSGVLLAGSRLPTHRNLASHLGVTVVTVTRAYAAAAARGLVESAVGRGTFVRASRREQSFAAMPAVDLNLAANVVHVPVPTLSRDLTHRLSATLSASYGVDGGSERHRSAGATLMATTRRDAEPSHVVVTAGTQHAMLVALAAVAKAGDTIMTEELTYHGMKSVAALLGLKLQPLALDRFGLVPDAFEQASRRRGARVLYISPTLQNPTGTVMPERRRREIAAIAIKHGVTIVEDDVLSFLLPDPPPAVTTFAPEQSLFLFGAGKSLTPALRVAYVLAPESLLARVTAAVAASTLFASPLSAEIAATWIEDGTAASLTAARRKIIADRQHLARRILGRRAGGGDAHSPHLWVSLPSRWSADAFADAARRRGVRVAPSTSFAVGETKANALRLSIGAPASGAQLESALQVIQSLLDRPDDEPTTTVV